MVKMALRSSLLVAMSISAGAISLPSAKKAPAAMISTKQEPLSPPLDPKSSKKFFGKDYPHDKQPANKDMSLPHAPYPKLQATNEFHKDVTQDENGDGGKWEAQMKFDIARHKLGKESAEMEKAKADKEKKDAKMKEAQAKAEAAKAKADAAKKEAEEAKAARAKAEEEAGGEVKKTKKDFATKEEEMAAKVAAAEAEYAKEKKQFANCQQELEDAKAKYEKLKAEEAALQKTDSEQAKLLKIDHTLIDQEKAKEDAAKNKLSVAEKERDEAEAVAAKERAENAKSMKALAKEKAEYDSIQAQLNAAEAKLKSRGEEGEEGGPKVRGLGNVGKHAKNKDKSAASARTLSQAAVLVAASAALSQLW